MSQDIVKRHHDEIASITVLKKLLYPNHLAGDAILNSDGYPCVGWRTISRGNSPPCGRGGDSTLADRGAV